MTEYFGVFKFNKTTILIKSFTVKTFLIQSYYKFKIKTVVYI